MVLFVIHLLFHCKWKLSPMFIIMLMHNLISFSFLGKKNKGSVVGVIRFSSKTMTHCICNLCSMYANSINN